MSATSLFHSHVVAAGELFEWRADKTDGWFLSTGERWTGYAVRWRKDGTRRWTKFNLVDCQEPARIPDAVIAHARPSRAAASGSAGNTDRGETA